jgi:hypothetical protein
MSVVLEERHFLASRAGSDRLGFNVVFAARDATGDVGTLSFTKVRLNPGHQRSE